MNATRLLMYVPSGFGSPPTTHAYEERAVLGKNALRPARGAAGPTRRRAVSRKRRRAWDRCTTAAVNEQALKRADDRLQIPELEKRARARRALTFVGLVVVAAAAGAYYTRPKPARPLYRTEPAARRTVVQLVETTGSLDVTSRVEVPAPTAGRLTAIAVQARDTVQKGQLLATLDQRAAELGVGGAHAAPQAAGGRVAQAQASLEAARRGLERAQALKQKGLASEQDVVEAQAQLDGARAALTAAQAERKVAGENLATAQLGQSLGAIVAPVDGVVLHAPDRVGAAVSPERGPLFVIAAPLSTMRVEAPVSETEIALIAPGHAAEVIVQALPDKVFSAKVDRVGIEPARDSGVVQYPVTLLVQNPDGLLLPGMSARVRMQVARADDALSVREAALRFSPEDTEPAASRSRVFRVNAAGTELEAVEVTPGISDGMFTAITPENPNALHPGDPVAIGLLSPGAASNKPSVSLGGGK
jgi:HlyD family secretion protein